MTRGTGRHNDPTAALAICDISGESLFTEVLARIGDKRERVLVLAHVSLGLTLATLARELGADQAELARLIEANLAMLQADDHLATALSDIRRAGRTESYQALAYRLGLMDWFCSQCGEFMIQPKVGRPRNTCSNKCRVQFHRAGSTGWKDLYQDSQPHDSASANQRTRPKDTVRADPEKVRALTRPWRSWYADTDPSRFWSADSARNRAILLLGFMCPLPVCPSDLAALDVGDVTLKPPGLEIRLFKRASQPTRYLPIPPSADQHHCPVEAVLTWQSILRRTGRTSGPLFIRAGEYGRLPPKSSVRLTSQAIAKVFTDSAHRAGCKDVPEIKSSTLLSDFLQVVSFPSMT